MNFGKSTTEKIQDNLGKRSAQVANGIEQAVDTAHEAAQETLANVSGKLDSIHGQAKPSIDRFAQRSAELAHKSIEATRDAGARVKKAAGRYASACESYVVEQPVKSVAIAAAAGAAVAALVMLSRNRSRNANSGNRFGLGSH